MRETEQIIISLKPTIKCNFNCGFCLSKSTSKTKSSVSQKELKKFFKCLKDTNFKGVVHISGGEPFLYAKLDSLIKSCCKNNLLTIISTNGSWIPSNPNKKQYRLFLDKLKKVFKKPNIKIRISMDSNHLNQKRGDPFGIERLKIFKTASKELGLVAGKDYSIMITEEKLENAKKMKKYISTFLGESTKSSKYIELREVVKLGRSKKGSEIPLNKTGFIPIRPDSNGNLQVYYGRKEESLNVSRGGIECLPKIIMEHRKIIDYTERNACACILSNSQLSFAKGE